MITPTHSVQPATQPGPVSKSAAVTSDFETFLLMMTTQAQNQDPLEPMDASDYASQLAQFSMVEQQVQTNDLLSSLATALGSVNLEELTNWVGMDVRSSEGFHFDAAPVTLFAQPDPTAEEVTLVVRDDQGNEVSRTTLPANQAEFVWAGTDAQGNPLPTGSYTATLESYRNGELVSETPAAAYSKVIEAQIAEGAVVLTLQGGLSVQATSVTGVRTGA